jgi:hypothetical protein
MFSDDEPQQKGGEQMLVHKIKIQVSRKRLNNKSSEKPKIVWASKPTADDSNFYQKAVESIYDSIDVLRLAFVMLTIKWLKLQSKNKKIYKEQLKC